MAKGELKLKMTIGQNANPNAKMTEDPKNNELLRTVIKDALSGSLAPDAIEEAQEQAKMLRDDLTRSGTMEQGTFDEDGNFITLDQTNRTFFASIYNRMKAALKAWAEFSADEEVQSLLVSLSFSEDSIRPFFEQLSTEDIFFISSLLPKVKPLIPYILQEVEELKKDPETENINIGELLQNTDKESPAADNLLIKLIVKARARMEDAQAAQLVTDKLTEDLPQLQGATLNKHSMLISAVANSLIGRVGTPEDPREGDVLVGRKGKQEVTTFVSLTTPDSSTIIKSKNHTPFDDEVMNIIISQYQFGDKSHIVTPAIVAKDLVGKKGSAPSAQLEKEVETSMDKMRVIDAEIDATEEAKIALKKQGKEIPENFSFHLRDQLLPARVVLVKRGKNTIKGYQIKNIPILLEHALVTKKITTVPASLLDIKEVDPKTGTLTDASIPMTAGRVVIRGYLLRRLSTLKHDHQQAKEALRKYNEKRRHKKDLPPKTLEDFAQQSPVILFSTLLDETQLKPKDTTGKKIDRNQEKRCRDFVIIVLDFFKAARFIDGYHLRRGKGRGNPIDGIVIDFND